MKSLLDLAPALWLACLGFTASAASPPALPDSKPINPAYLAKFSSCDSTDRFGGVQLPIKTPSGKTLWYGCKTDPSRFRRFDRSAAIGNQPEAIIIISKLGHDEDGSAAACHNAGGPTDQCTTSLMVKATANHPCQIKTPSPLCAPVNPDEVPYIVIPTSAPRSTPSIEAGAFRRLSGLSIGDYGVVIVGDRIVPVIIADGGPAYKIGEGSTARSHAALTGWLLSNWKTGEADYEIIDMAGERISGQWGLLLDDESFQAAFNAFTETLRTEDPCKTSSASDL